MNSGCGLCDRSPPPYLTESRHDANGWALVLWHFAFIIYMLYVSTPYVLGGSVTVSTINHGAGAYQRVARISTRENSVTEGLRFG